MEPLAPWLGLVGGACGWLLSHQAGSNSVFDDCRIGEGWFVILVGLLGLALALGGGLVSLTIWRRGDGETEGRRFMGLVGALLASLAAFAIILQSVAGLILPRCLA